MLLLFQISLLLFLITEIGTVGIGKAWQILPYTTDYWNHPSWPRLDSSAFEVRSVSGVGHLNPSETTQKELKLDQSKSIQPNIIPLSKSNILFSQKYFNQFEKNFEDSSYDQYENQNLMNDAAEDKIFKAGIAMTILDPKDNKDLLKNTADETRKIVPRIRRDTENETKMEQISTSKNVREIRLNSIVNL